MQVNNQAYVSQSMTNDKPLELKQGEIYSATVKERTSQNEATLQIRGREVQVKFEGKVPIQDRVTVQISQQIDQHVQVKVISEASRPETGNRQTEAATTQQALKSLGVANPSKELQQAAQIILDKGIPLNKESVQDLRNFMVKEKGTIEQRLNTVQAIANKRLEVTTTHLRAVNEALNGRPLNEVLTSIAKELDPNFQVRSGQLETRQPVDSRVVESRLVQERPVSEQVRMTESEARQPVSIKQEIPGGVEKQLIVSERPSEVLKQLHGTVQKEADFVVALNKLLNKIENSPFDGPIKDNLLRELTEASNLHDKGRELAARERLLQSFIAVESQVAKLDQRSQPETQQYILNEAYQTIPVSSKDYIVKTVTEKLANAQVEFKAMQREMLRNLENIQRLTQTFKNQAINQVKPLLEATIKKLDHAILKSEMMLLTDMKTEKNLMQASSQLTEARKQLLKGNYQEANRIVQDVKSLIERLNFKPSDTKIKHFVSKEEQNFSNRLNSQPFIRQFDDLSRRATLQQEPSARQAFELVRSLGLNRDSEVGQMLASGKQGEPTQNIKQALLQLMKMEEEGRLSSNTNQALSNITGQQLLSKSDSNNLQSMFFNLPFLLQDEVKTLQVHVNSKNEGQQVDWENCNLYFLIETKKLGEVGILVTTTDRNLSLTIKNDQPLFKERMEPLAIVCKEKLKEVGYNIANISFTRLHGVPKSGNIVRDQELTEKMTPTFTERGYDFKI